MLSFIQRFFHWLLSKEFEEILQESRDVKKANLEITSRNVELARDLDTLISKMKEDRRITLKDLKLQPNQYIVLRGCSSELRQALYDSGEHICLTELNECCRKTAVKYRNYQMELTLHPTRQNEIASDRTLADEINERRKKLFSPRSVDGK